MATALPRFNGRTSLIDFSGVPSYAFHVWWDKVASTVESNINDLSDQLAAIQAAQAAADAAQTTADSKAKVTRATTAPASPATNDVWVDTSVSPVVVKVWDGSAWQQSARNTTNTNQITDGAGLGNTATWTGVSSRPTELTDGRISTALNSSGQLQSTVTTTAKTNSNILSRTGGGTFTGDTNATFGANLATNVTGDLDDVADGSTYAKLNAFDISGGFLKLRVPGSGPALTVGDQRNLPPITGAGGRYKFTGAVTYSVDGTGTNATISVAAGSLVAGSVSTSYNAMSANVSGSGTVIYYLYVNTNQFTAGAHTLLTTTSGNTIYNNDNNVFIGSVSVTYSASGGGGGFGGGGFGDCPWAEAWVHTRRGWIKAKDVVPGDEVLILSEDRLRAEEYETVTSNHAAEEHCHVIYGLTTGIKVTVSDSTPITLQDGSLITVKEIDTHALPFEEDGVLWWEPCKILPAGVLPVQHIKCNNKTYSAGDVIGKGILTHNPKP